MRPIILHIDYNYQKQPNYIKTKNTQVIKNIINITNKNICNLNINTLHKKEVISQPNHKKTNIKHKDNNEKSYIKNTSTKQNEINKINNIDDFLNMIKTKNVIYYHSTNKKPSSNYISLIKNHQKLFLPTGKNDHTIILSPTDRLGKGAYGTAYRIGNYVIKIPNSAKILRDNKNADYQRCARVLNEVNEDNDFSRSIQLSNNQNVLITKYVEGQSITGEEAYLFVKNRNRILFDYDSKGNVRKNKEGKHILIDADLAAQPKKLSRIPSTGTLAIYEIYQLYYNEDPLKK